VVVGTISRRNCLKLLLAANAAWLGSAFAGPLISESTVSRVSSYTVPIEGLGLGIRFTNVLRYSLKITTVGKLLDVLGGSDEELRGYRYGFKHDSVVFTEGTVRDIRAQLAVFARSGPVPFETLTRFESAVLGSIADGHSLKEMSAQFCTSQQVVKAQLRSMCRKFGGRCAPYES